MKKTKKENLKNDLKERMFRLMQEQKEQRRERLARAVNSNFLQTDAGKTLKNNWGERPTIAENCAAMNAEPPEDTYFYTGMYSDSPSVYEEAKDIAKVVF